MAKSTSLEDFKDYKDMESTELEWCRESMGAFVEAGIINGDGGMILPKAPLTRAQFVVMLSRLGVVAGIVTEGELKESETPHFSDVEAGSWHAGPVSWATEKGIINGVGGGQFAPQGRLTGEQMATILYRFIKACAIDIGTSNKFFETENVSAWAVPGVQLCLDYDLLTGVPQMVGFKEQVNRATAVHTLYNMCLRGKITL